VSPLEVCAIVVVVTAAACLQGAVGFGMALVAAPILVLIDARLVPGPLTASSLVLCSLLSLRDGVHADLEKVRFSMLGNPVGACAGAFVLTLLDPSGFAVLFGLLVLLGVGLSAAGLRVVVTRGTALGAGLLGGFMGTTSSIGGPPMALVYQHTGAEQFRGTLSLYFVVSCSVSLVALSVAGRFGAEELGLALYLVPAQVAGFALSFALRRWIEGSSIRPFVLGLSALAGAVVLGRALLV
jgi:uncharacterized membrane protein YfcA